MLNGATVSDAVCLVVPPGVQLELPLHILNLTTGVPPLLLHTIQAIAGIILPTVVPQHD